MKLDNGSFEFNVVIDNGGGTPSWGTALGQGNLAKFTDARKLPLEEILRGMLYKHIKRNSDGKFDGLTWTFGKGHTQNDNSEDMYEILIASKFDKVYVNNELIEDASYILLLIEQKHGVHGADSIDRPNCGRKSIKYHPNYDYEDRNVNQNCIKLIREKLGISDNGSWFIYDIDICNQDELHFKAIILDNDNETHFPDSNTRSNKYRMLIEESNRVNKAKNGTNIIFYGCPGSGKSHLVKEKLKGVPDENVFRITFHPEYSYYDFVGQLMPDRDESNQLCYTFKKGPFALALERAYSTDSMVYLVIEEINRGNASAIFGEIFQLLDRVESKTDPHFGESEYPITDSELQKALDLGNMKVYLPSNLTIYATMNTSDQNVFSLDTAFKRRWIFEQVPNSFKNHKFKDWLVPGTQISWENFVNKINKKLTDQNAIDSISDDRRIGAYFVTENLLIDPENNEYTAADKRNIAKLFAEKIIEYLWDDVATYETREQWFNMSKVKTLEDAIKKFCEPDTDETPLKIFTFDF